VSLIELKIFATAVWLIVALVLWVALGSILWPESFVGTFLGCFGFVCVIAPLGYREICWVRCERHNGVSR
jgi:hypothetical protein